MINETNAKAYCSEDISDIENYEQAVNDDTQMWDCHHKLEIQGQFRNSISLLKKCGLYYNVPAWQLIFLTKSEHTRLHKLGGRLSTETRKKLSASRSGKFCGERNSMFGKRHSADTRKKMSMSRIGKHPSEETRKKLSLSRSGERNPMFGKRGEKSHVFGRKWWNNGFKCVRSRECPGEGWVRGRLKRNI